MPSPPLRSSAIILLRAKCPSDSMSSPTSWKALARPGPGAALALIRFDIVAAQESDSMSSPISREGHPGLCSGICRTPSGIFSALSFQLPNCYTGCDAELNWKVPTFRGIAERNLEWTSSRFPTNCISILGRTIIAMSTISMKTSGDTISAFSHIKTLMTDGIMT